MSGNEGLPTEGHYVHVPHTPLALPRSEGGGSGQGGPTGPWRVLLTWGCLGCSNGQTTGDCQGPYFGSWHAVGLQRKFVE